MRKLFAIATSITVGMAAFAMPGALASHHSPPGALASHHSPYVQEPLCIATCVWQMPMKRVSEAERILNPGLPAYMPAGEHFCSPRMTDFEKMACEEVGFWGQPSNKDDYEPIVIPPEFVEKFIGDLPFDIDDNPFDDYDHYNFQNRVLVIPLE